MVGLWEQIYHRHAADLVTRTQQAGEVARERCRIARDDRNARRAQLGQPLYDLFSKADTWRVKQYEVGGRLDSFQKPAALACSARTDPGALHIET